MAAPEPPHNQVLGGYLTKQGRKVKSWRRRWFILENNGKLTYYSATPGVKGAKILGWMDVGTCSAVLPGGRCIDCDWPKASLQYCFGLISPQRKLYLVADGVADLGSWLRALRKILPEHVPVTTLSDISTSFGLAPVASMPLPPVPPPVSSPPASSTRITLLRNNGDRVGKLVAAPKDLCDCLALASSLLGIHATRLFTETGGEITDFSLVRDNDVIYASEGEPFAASQAPAPDGKPPLSPRSPQSAALKSPLLLPSSPSSTTVLPVVMAGGGAACGGAAGGVNGKEEASAVAAAVAVAVAVGRAPTAAPLVAGSVPGYAVALVAPNASGAMSNATGQHPQDGPGPTLGSTYTDPDLLSTPQPAAAQRSSSNSTHPNLAPAPAPAMIPLGASVNAAAYLNLAAMVLPPAGPDATQAPYQNLASARAAPATGQVGAPVRTGFAANAVDVSSSQPYSPASATAAPEPTPDHGTRASNPSTASPVAGPAVIAAAAPHSSACPPPPTSTPVCASLSLAHAAAADGAGDTETNADATASRALPLDAVAHDAAAITLEADNVTFNDGAAAAAVARDAAEPSFSDPSAVFVPDAAHNVDEALAPSAPVDSGNDQAEEAAYIDPELIRARKHSSASGAVAGPPMDDGAGYHERPVLASDFEAPAYAEIDAVYHERPRMPGDDQHSGYHERPPMAGDDVANVYAVPVYAEPQDILTRPLDVDSAAVGYVDPNLIEAAYLEAGVTLAPHSQVDESVGYVQLGRNNNARAAAGDGTSEDVCPPGYIALEDARGEYSEDDEIEESPLPSPAHVAPALIANPPSAAANAVQRGPTITSRVQF